MKTTNPTEAKPPVVKECAPSLVEEVAQAIAEADSPFAHAAYGSDWEYDNRRPEDIARVQALAAIAVVLRRMEEPIARAVCLARGQLPDADYVVHPNGSLQPAPGWPMERALPEARAMLAAFRKDNGIE